jgi:hypothetical protein
LTARRLHRVPETPSRHSVCQSRTIRSIDSPRPSATRGVLQSSNRALVFWLEVPHRSVEMQGAVASQSETSASRVRVPRVPPTGICTKSRWQIMQRLTPELCSPSVLPTYCQRRGRTRMLSYQLMIQTSNVAAQRMDPNRVGRPCCEVDASTDQKVAGSSPAERTPKPQVSGRRSRLGPPDQGSSSTRMTRAPHGAPFTALLSAFVAAAISSGCVWLDRPSTVHNN